jgi:hypothetical protein
VFFAGVDPYFENHMPGDIVDRDTGTPLETQWLLRITEIDNRGVISVVRTDDDGGAVYSFDAANALLAKIVGNSAFEISELNVGDVINAYVVDGVLEAAVVVG